MSDDRGVSPRGPSKENPICCPACGYWLTGSILNEAGRTWHADCLARIVIADRDRLREAAGRVAEARKRGSAVFQSADLFGAVDALIGALEPATPEEEQ